MWVRFTEESISAEQFSPAIHALVERMGGDSSWLPTSADERVVDFPFDADLALIQLLNSDEAVENWDEE